MTYEFLSHLIKNSSFLKKYVSIFKTLVFNPPILAIIFMYVFNCNFLFHLIFKGKNFKFDFF